MGTEQLPFHFSLSCIGEGNGNPLQCSCLGNPRDGGAWWAAVYGVTRSLTRLKRLSSSIPPKYSQGDFQGLGAQQSLSIHSLNLLFFQSVSLQTYCYLPGGGDGEGERQRENMNMGYNGSFFLRDQSPKAVPKFFCL